MSHVEFQTFAQKAVSLDVPERIELITFLVKSFPQAQVKPTDKTEVEKINAVLEKISATGQLVDLGVPLGSEVGFRRPIFPTMCFFQKN